MWSNAVGSKLENHGLQSTNFCAAIIRTTKQTHILKTTQRQMVIATLPCEVGVI